MQTRGVARGCGSGEVWVRAESGPGVGGQLRVRRAALNRGTLPCPVLTYPLVPATTDFTVRTYAAEAAYYQSRLTGSWSTWSAAGLSLLPPL